MPDKRNWSSEVLKCEFEDAIDSVPIVYLPHHDYALILDALSEVLASSESQKMSLDRNAVFFISNLGRITLGAKNYLLTNKSISGGKSLENFLLNYLYGDGIINTKREFCIIGNPCFSIGSENNTDRIILTSFLQDFYSRYVKGLEPNIRTVILIDPSLSGLPKEIEKITRIINIAPPINDEIENLIKDDYESRKSRGQILHDNFSESKVKDLARTLQGLDRSDIKQILRILSLNNRYSFAIDFIPMAMREKKNIVMKSGLLDVITPDIQMDNIGGLSNLKNDLKPKKAFFENLPESIYDYHVPIPKGILIIGMPGCGKSMMAQAIAKEFNKPLLKLDMSKILGEYVGQSEKNFRHVLELVDAASPCVLWIDEIEKAFSGADSEPGSGKNDVVMRMMGHFLTWMQEHTKPVFIVATANDVLRPEFMRKGRFDEVYFVGFPTEEDVKNIFKAHVSKYNDIKGKICFNLSENDYAELATQAYHFTGSEIASILNKAVEKRFEAIIDKKKKKEDLREDIKEIGVNDIMALVKQYESSHAKLSFAYDQCCDKGGVFKKEKTIGQENNAIIRIALLNEEHHFRIA